MRNTLEVKDLNTYFKSDYGSIKALENIWNDSLLPKLDFGFGLVLVL